MGAAADTALSFSFGLILTPSSFGFGLLGFEDEIEDTNGAEAKGDEANFKSDGGGISGLEAEEAFVFMVRRVLGLACGSEVDVCGLGGREG